MEPLSPIVDPMMLEHVVAHQQRNGDFAIAHDWSFEAGPFAVEPAWAHAVLARGYSPEAMHARTTGAHDGRGARTELVQIATRTSTARYVHPLREVTSVQSTLPIPDMFVGRSRTSRRHGVLSSGRWTPRVNEFRPPVWAAGWHGQTIMLQGSVLAAQEAMPPRPFAEWLLHVAEPIDEVVVRGGFVFVLARTTMPPPPVEEALAIASTIADHLEDAVRPG